MKSHYAADDLQLLKYTYNKVTKAFAHGRLFTELKEIPSLLDNQSVTEELRATSENRILPSQINHLLRIFTEHHRFAFIEGLPFSWMAACLSHEFRQESNIKPRFEARTDPDGQIVNIAASYKNAEDRDYYFKNGAYKNIDVVFGGRTTVEIGVHGINKATVLYYLSKHLGDVFSEKSNELDDKRPLIVADFDGTLTDEPTPGVDKPSTYLNNAPTKAGFIDFLRKGGLIVVSSGNAYQRVLERVLSAFNENNKHLLSQIAIAASGGHMLFKIDPVSLQPVSIPDYRKKALQQQEMYEKKCKGKVQFDRFVLTLGDDGKVNGNDFAMIGKAMHGICVSKKPLDDDAKALCQNHVPGGPEAVAAILTVLNQEMCGGDNSHIHYPSIEILAEKSRLLVSSQKSVFPPEKHYQFSR